MERSIVSNTMSIPRTECEFCLEPLELQEMMVNELSEVDTPRICESCTEELLSVESEMQETY